jgi:hypothetical protein
MSVNERGHYVIEGKEETRIPRGNGEPATGAANVLGDPVRLQQYYDATNDPENASNVWASSAGPERAGSTAAGSTTHSYRGNKWYRRH